MLQDAKNTQKNAKKIPKKCLFCSHFALKNVTWLLFENFAASF